VDFHKYDPREAYKRDLSLVDGVAEGILWERDSDGINTGRSCRVLCVRGSVADSDIVAAAVGAGMSPADALIGCQLVDDTDIVPKPLYAIVTDEVEWIIKYPIERTPGRVYDCVCGRPDELALV
jgi:hypothetical protein